MQRASEQSPVEMFEEVLGLLAALVAFGMPFFILAMPAVVLLGLAVIPLVVLAIPLAVVGALLAVPYLLIRSVRRRRSGPSPRARAGSSPGAWTVRP
jgi:membrane protein implicated in regulation of membrane protease activity